MISYDDVINVVSSRYEQLTYLDSHNFDEIVDKFIHTHNRWYKVNYAMADPLKFGFNLGCEFAKESCMQYMETKRAEYVIASSLTQYPHRSYINQYCVGSVCACVRVFLIPQYINAYFMLTFVCFCINIDLKLYQLSHCICINYIYIIFT